MKRKQHSSVRRTLAVYEKWDKENFGEFEEKQEEHIDRLIKARHDDNKEKTSKR